MKSTRASRFNFLFLDQFVLELIIKEHKFLWDLKDNKLSIKVVDASGNMLLESDSSKNFINLYKRNAEVMESSGFFQVDHSAHDFICDRTEIDDVTTDGSTLRFKLTNFGESCMANSKLNFTINSKAQVELSHETEDFEKLDLDSVLYNIKSHKEENY